MPKAKSNKAYKMSFKEFLSVNTRFTHVHMDIVGPLPPCKSINDEQLPYQYLVTFIDRFTRWIEVTPVTGISAEEIANAFISTWVSRFGTPLELTTDRGKQFESELFHQLQKVIGFTRIRTTSYLPLCQKS